MYQKIFNNPNFLVYYNTIDAKEENFFSNIIDLIIKYPLVWYNFVENILKNNIILVCEYNTLIISYSCLTSKLKNIFEIVLKVMQDSLIVTKIIDNNDFLIIYLYSKNISEFFKNSGFWLEYLTHYTILNIIGHGAYRGTLLRTNDNHLHEIDVIFEINDFLFLIECKDTNIYDEEDLKKLSNLKKKILDNSILAFVVTKGDQNNELDFAKYDIQLLRYKYDYWRFEEEMKEFIINKMLKYSF